MNAFELLTAPGPAAIAVIRLRGPAVGEFSATHLRRTNNRPVELAPGRVTHCDLLTSDGVRLDDVVIIVDRGSPDWDLRLHLHGGPGVHAACVELLAQRGFVARPADAQTLWDVAHEIEAECFALLPQMLTLRGARWLLTSAQRVAHDHSAGTLDGAALKSSPYFRLFAEPTRIALVGPPNAGKSTLINRLADYAVSIVAPTPGTTRDWIEAPGELDGFPLLWRDTAGLRTATDEIEVEGMQRSLQLLDRSDHFVLVLDAAGLESASQAVAAIRAMDRKPVAVLWNKLDLGSHAAAERSIVPPDWRDAAMEVSALTGAGIEAFLSDLRARVFPADAELQAD